MEEPKRSISKLLGDISAQAGALVGAQLEMLSLEMQQKASGIAAAFLWLGAAALTLVAAFALGLAGLVLVAVRMGMAADSAAAVLALLLACLGLLFLLRGRALMRDVEIYPARTFAEIRAGVDIFKRRQPDA